MRRPFIEHLRQLEEQTSRPTSRRIAELLPEIEVALAQGFRRAQIVSALKTEGIDITPAMLSTYLHRLRKRPATKTLPSESTSPSTPEAPSPPEVQATAGVVPNYQYGAHDPRRLDEVMRNRPDLKALAKLAKKGKP